MNVSSLKYYRFLMFQSQRSSTYTSTMRPLLVFALFTTMLIGVARAEDAVKPQATRTKKIDFAKERKWWSYAPISDQSPPDVNDQAWCKNDIDRFILTKLKAIGLSPAPQANRVALIRWISLLSVDTQSYEPTLLAASNASGLR